MSEHTQVITDASFDIDVLNADLPVLLDFWAPWCGPCKMITPMLEEVGAKYKGKLKIGKMNVDENTDIPSRFGIRGIPTLILFKKGEVVGTKVGAISQSDLLAFIADNT